MPACLGREHGIVSAGPIMLASGVEPYPGYRLIQPFGRGGWGEVWRAHQPDGGECALKFMPCDPGLAPSREIRALQALRDLRHEHILETRNIWSCPGYIVIVMDLCDGTLLELLDVYLRELKMPMTASHVCFFLSEAADAIDFLNARIHIINGQRMAVRHCDVKPSNLLVCGNSVKLADFSLAVPTTANMWYHRRAGTPRYCAPEVFQGWLSDRTDQYALAVSYYQLRTGIFPFPNAPSTVRPSYVPPPPDLSEVPRSERSILLRALAPVPQDRWATCGEMMQLLSQCCKPASPPLVR
jgi:serine/threonine protein kinase